MFIRKTQITNRESKKSYWNFQLVESIRTERGPRQRILLNLGADLNLDEQERKELANRIEEILRGVIPLLPSTEKIESYAQKFASALREQLFTKTPSYLPPDQAQDLQTIDLETIEQIEPRTVGNEHLLLHIAKELDLPKKLQKLGLSEKQVSLALGSVIGRAIFPASERATHKWLQERSGLGELLGCDFTSSSLDQFYQISDVLLSRKEEIEDHLERAESNLYGLQSTMVLYDLTNTYMEGKAKRNPKALHGRSKEKRTDCPLVTLGLVINEHGFAKRSAFLPGNIGEPTTLQKAIEQLKLYDTLLKPTVVLDAGIASEDNLQWLRENHYTYIVSARQKAPSMELIGELVSVDAETTEVRAAHIQSGTEEENWLYCESVAKTAVGQAMKTRFQKRFEEDLKKLAEGLAKPLGRKQYDKILLRIGRLKEKHKAISGCYKIDVLLSEDGKTVAGLTWAAIEEKMEEKLKGHYFLRTNLKNKSPQELWGLYGNLRTVEEAFRFMKSSLGMRPVYHQIEKRVDGHLWITILAYHLIWNAQYRLRQEKIMEQWETIRNLLGTRIRITLQAQTAEGKILHHRSTTKAEEHQTKIYQALGLSPQILKAKKIFF
jgi:transposase